MPFYGYSDVAVYSADNFIDNDAYVTSPLVQAATPCMPSSFPFQNSFMFSPSMFNPGPIPLPRSESGSLDDEDEEDEGMQESPNLTLSHEMPQHSNSSSATTKDSKARAVPRLRTAIRTPQRPGAGVMRKTSPEINTLRQAHNEIEQQYRLRLNGQFEQVLATLPDSYRDQANRERGRRRRSRVSKAEVLDLARRYILALQDEVRQKDKENEEMAKALEAMERPEKTGGQKRKEKCQA
ncbi:hypothetical protein B0I35DRAFT_75802 [Stachybotrys elegans]|uniref:BHLH domain-containing protein n=1 Tax=Stachybotrys elegans TaxID=80388 RepID=A0A8K0SK53_9HYPO|nr:hypothetical protein B0I35DRAFT_75802 [Stachybotrys elegans]